MKAVARSLVDSLWRSPGGGPRITSSISGNQKKEKRETHDASL